MTEEEYRTQIKLLEAENGSLKDRIVELETAIKQFGEAIGERLQEHIPIKVPPSLKPDHSKNFQRG